LVRKLVDLSRVHETGVSKVLIYVRSPVQAQEIVSELRKQLAEGNKRVTLLTGAIRGYERDQFATCNQIYRAFLDSGAIPPASVYLVSASAGEVGIDLDADHLVCDLTTLDAMIRLGRVNRRGGEGRIARIHVVVPKQVKCDTELVKISCCNGRDSQPLDEIRSQQRRKH
jgi:CRISPR-associated endonuclease/helicase Cas3